jgi:hypothetical protein
MSTRTNSTSISNNNNSSSFLDSLINTPSLSSRPRNLGIPSSPAFPKLLPNLRCLRHFLPVVLSMPAAESDEDTPNSNMSLAKVPMLPWHQLLAANLPSKEVLSTQALSQCLAILRTLPSSNSFPPWAHRPATPQHP